jgi:hypothetical protein
MPDDSSQNYAAYVSELGGRATPGAATPATELAAPGGSHPPVGIGRRTVNVLPRVSSLTTWTVPPCCSTMSRTLASPGLVCGRTRNRTQPVHQPLSRIMRLSADGLE